VSLRGDPQQYDNEIALLTPAAEVP